MIKYIGLFVLVLCAGCGSDGNSSAIDYLEGNWTSACYELLDDEDESFIAYVIDDYSFSDGSYTLQSTAYDDSACESPSGYADDYFGDYVIKENLTSSDGKTVTHISVTQDSPDWPEGLGPVSFDIVFYINGDELMFGEYGEPPVLNMSLIYAREL